MKIIAPQKRSFRGEGWAISTKLLCYAIACLTWTEIDLTKNKLRPSYIRAYCIFLLLYHQYLPCLLCDMDKRKCNSYFHVQMYNLFYLNYLRHILHDLAFKKKIIRSLELNVSLNEINLLSGKVWLVIVKVGVFVVVLD